MSPRVTPYIKATPTPKQAALMLCDNLEAFYGGAAGGGKSVGLLMGALQYVDQEDYAALILRRTFSDLSLPGALMDVAASWLGGTDARYNTQTHTWTFPNGAKLTFGFLETEADKYRYQSTEFQYIAFDELTQFTESQYTYLFSRLRKKKTSKIPLRVHSASNPGGAGHDWVKVRFVRRPPEDKADRVFIPATLEDNPHLNRLEYESSLAQLDPITRQQLRIGDWDAHPGGDIFKREWLRFYDEAPGDMERIVQGWDLAISQKTTSDYTAGVTLGVKEGRWYILDIFRSRVDFPTALRAIRSRAEMFEPESVVVESNNYQLAVVQELRRTTHIPVIPQVAKKDKVQRLMGLAALFEGERIILKRTMRDFVSEYLQFPQGAHDDMLDALWYATERLRHTGPKPSGINIDALGGMI